LELSWRAQYELSPKGRDLPDLNKGLGVRIKDEEGHFSFGGF
jgi:hypothetical protein